MLSRSFLLFAASSLALFTSACTSLTRPEEITISAEPIARTQPAPALEVAGTRGGAHGAAAAPAPAPGRPAQPASGG